ncbi:MAG: M23 family metallopeptidase [Flavobacteriales bacterium]
MKNTSYNFLVLLLTLSASIFAQDTLSADSCKIDYCKGYFIWPTDGPIGCAGNFGELRNNHFHGGLDVKTQGVENRNIYAAADGYVSSISLSPYGYGRTLFITHPNGLTTVYAHLNKMAPKIDTALRNYQYKVQWNDMDVHFPKDSIKVKQGELVALSGNTGSSEHPHLHFEIRKGDIQINPLLFGFPVKDKINPEIYGIRVYPLSDSSSVNGQLSAQYFHTVKLNGNYHLFTEKDSTVHPNPITVYGPIGFGISTIDKLSGYNNICGVYIISLAVDSHEVYRHEMDHIAFSNTRYINTHTDYNYRANNHRWIHKSYLDQNNQLGIYDNVENEGRITLNDTNLHTITYTVYDAYLNKTTLSFKVRQGAKGPVCTPKICSDPMICHDKDFQFTDNDFSIDIKPYTVYNTCNFKHTKKPKAGRCLSDIHQVLGEGTPIQRKVTMYFTVDSSLFPMQDKLTIAKVNFNGIPSKHFTTEFRNNSVKAEVKYLGAYCLSIDTLKPFITPNSSNKNNCNIANLTQLKFQIEDWGTGLYKYDIYFDDVWEIASMDKHGILTADIPKYLTEGPHTVRVVVSDGNKNTQELKLTINK